MSSRTIVECDGCRREVKPTPDTDARLAVFENGVVYSVDLCSACLPCALAGLPAKLTSRFGRPEGTAK
jgi:hypothetical protein